jgi:hypothetical protein
MYPKKNERRKTQDIVIVRNENNIL